MAYAEEQGVLVVSACGNSGDEIYILPRMTRLSEWGSHTNAFEPAAFSCQGSGLDMLMYGENLKVVSIKNAADYEADKRHLVFNGFDHGSRGSGALEHYPHLTPSQIRYLMRASCDDICDADMMKKSGYGIFNPDRFYENPPAFRSR